VVEMKHLKNIINLYTKNIKVVLLFSILLGFGFLFSMFGNVRIASGNIFVSVGSAEVVALETALFLIMLVFFSSVSAILIFSVRKELSKLRLEYYLKEVLQKFAIRLFGFYLFASILFLGISVLSVRYWFLQVVEFFIAVIFLFVPQSIVIDESNVESAISKSIEFIFSYPKSFVSVFVLGILLLFLSISAEVIFDPLFFSGKVFSLLFSCIVAIPLFEIAKSYFYMRKFGLVGAYLK